jgi:hypothetical protein
MADDIKKRKRLSGSQYLKKRLAWETDLVKQKGSLLKFFPQNGQEKVSNDYDTDNSEENSGNKNIKDIHDINRKKNDFDSENENKKEIAISEENIENEKSYNDDEKYTNFKYLDLDDPNKWPFIDEKLRLYFIECEPRQINMETFPINTSCRSFSTFHYFRLLPNGECIKLYSSNNGNFLKFIEFLSKFDPVMKEHIRRISSQEIHCHYLGKDIQNEVIQLLANKIRFRIVTALKNAKYYSIILDCTPDINHTEQMTVIVRFVSTTENETSKIEQVSINEHFIGFIELHNTTGLNMTDVILQKLRELDISLDEI